MLWWWRVVVAVVILLLPLATPEHLSKEFASARKEAARSMEPVKEGHAGMSSTFDVGAILCEKYGEWSQWSTCSRKCEQTRGRQCRIPEECGRSWVKEKRTCTRENGACSTLSYKVIGMQKRNRLIEELLYDLLYSSWTPWGSCSRACRQRRQRKCKYKAICIRSYIQEERRCQVAGSECEHRFSLKPLGLGKDDVQSNNETTNTSENTEDDISYDGGDNSEADYSMIPVKGEANAEGEHFSLLSIVKDPEKKPDEYRGTDGVHGYISGRRRTIEKSGDEDSQHKRKERKGPTLEEELTAAQKNCGIRPRLAFGTYRVVGGQEVQKNSWPWQVAILTKFHEQYCGGTLISPRWVLTAAHCVRKKGKRRKLIVRIGEHDISEYEPSQEDIRSEQEFPHPEFDYHTITNDIALIKLRHPPSAFAQPGFACLPSSNYSPPRDQLCTIVGWGKLKNTHSYGSNSLQEVQIPVVRHRKCERVFDYVITQKQVCAGYKKGGKDSCAGDSGGPLLCSWEDGSTTKYVIYGVTSYGEGCGRKGKYGIYTKVASYRDWIEKTISENS